MKTNMVACEVRVNTTGLQPGERGLFTEETSSVLVHETGGVIQLSAKVARGQLLLLANVETKREVVVQVKRTYQSMNRCVELEFAEPAPRFWGMEFSAATALLPKAAEDAEAAAKIPAEVSPDASAESVPSPTMQEVEAFKRGVNFFRGEASPDAEPLLEEASPVPMESTAAQPLPLPQPSLDYTNFTVPLPRTRRLLWGRGKLTPGAKSRLAVLTTALVVTVGGAAWFKHWIPGRAEKKESPYVPAVSANVSTSLTTTGPEAPRQQRKSSKVNAAVDTAVDAPEISPSMPTQIDDSPVQPFASRGYTPHADVRRTSPSATPPAATFEVKARVRSPAQPVPTPIVASQTEGVVVPPKLIKSVRAVAPLDDARDFETGNVVLDAVVGTEGEVHFITVISGPPSLRSAAVEAAKQYRYEPATRNGQPVPEHVHITIRFRFES